MLGKYIVSNIIYMKLLFLIEIKNHQICISHKNIKILKKSTLWLLDNNCVSKIQTLLSFFKSSNSISLFFLLLHLVIIWLLICSCFGIHIRYLKITWCLITRLTSCLWSCNSSRSLMPFQSLQNFFWNFFFLKKTFFLVFLFTFLFFRWLFFIFTLFFSFVSSGWSLYFRWRLFFFFLFFFYGCTSCVNSKPLNN